MSATRTTATLVSACLLGEHCRYDGGHCSSKATDMALDGLHVVGICPEQLGGLGTPRPRSWIEGGDGHDVLEGSARVVNEAGQDVTEVYIQGAEAALEEAIQTGAKMAYLKARSPSCGFGKTYSSGNVLAEGDGVTTARLLRAGIKIVLVD